MAFIDNPNTIEDYQNNELEYQNKLSELKSEIENLNSQNSENLNNIEKLQNDLSASRELVSQYAHKVVTGFVNTNNEGDNEEAKTRSLDDIAKDFI